MPELDWIVGIDAGGTFTDAIAIRADGATKVAKVPSTPHDPGLAFERAVAALASGGVDAGHARMIFHGTTAATNALLTGGLARVVLATTKGFRDILGYRDGTRPAVYQLTQPRPRELALRRDRIEVDERLSGLGETVTALRESEIDRVVAEIAAREPEAVAVAFLFSYLDNKHERALGEAVARRLPGVPVSLSSSVAREFREYPRTATAVVNAGLRPVVGRYLLGLRSRVAPPGPAGETGTGPSLLIMQSNGGCVPAERAEEQAHRLILSGPAAGVAGAVAIGARYGIRQLVSLDMGGTSLDVCLVPDGVPPVTPTQLAEDNLILCPSVDIVTAGAGGGSIAHVDRAGRLRIGPESAGAVPGPAAYGAGGDRPTLTDAHVVAGTLPASLPLAGQLTLDAAAATAAVARAGGQLGLPAGDAADGMVRLAVAQMTGALRQVSVQRGIDPREYTLVAFGGAGPLHAGLLLREMGFRAVLIPRYPGLFAASGLLSTDLRIDESRTVLRVHGPGLVPELAAWYAETARQLTARLRGDGIARTRIRLAASADCRFVGQGYELTIPVTPRGRPGIVSLAARFRGAHLRSYGHADPAQDVEVVTVRLSAFGALPVPAPGSAAPAGTPPGGAGLASGEPGATARLGRARARLPGTRAPRSLPVYDRARLAPGETVTGPAIVYQDDSTTVILAGQQARTDAHGTMWLAESR
jgi:N-methylhydantoinase A